MKIVICPGFHPVSLTESFVAQIQNHLILQQEHLPEFVVFPSDRLPPYSPHHLLPYLLEEPVLLIGFSAGVVGAGGAARLHQKQGGTIRALITIDGWGVPLWGNFPIHRISHDFFTHQTSALLGAGLDSFYADPAIAHLTLWHSPHLASGYRLPVSPQRTTPKAPPRSSTAATFIADLIHHYQAVK